MVIEDSLDLLDLIQICDDIFDLPIMNIELLGIPKSLTILITTAFRSIHELI